MAVEVSMEAMIRGYHVYRDVWSAVVDEELACKREPFNASDPFAVAVVKGDTTIGHVPRKISAICSLFLRRNGTIRCKVTGARRYSADLPQGGLEIPCTLTFQGDARVVTKVSQLFPTVMTSPEKTPSNKRRKVEPEKTTMSQTTQDWLQLGGIVLTCEDKAVLSNGGKLNDKHIYFSQQLLKTQFPGLNGLRSTLLQTKKEPLPTSKQVVQIVHSRGDHWVALSTINAVADEVYVYDSVYRTLDDESTQAILTLFQAATHPLQIQMIQSQKQRGATDCGLFSIATITAIAFHIDPTTITFDQAAMRPHLAQCFEEHTLKPFPTK